MQFRERFLISLTTLLLVSVTFSSSFVGGSKRSLGGSDATARTHSNHDMTSTMPSPQEAAKNGAETETHPLGPLSLNVVKMPGMDHAMSAPMTRGQVDRILKASRFTSNPLGVLAARLATNTPDPSVAQTSRPAQIVDVAVGLGGTLSYIPEDITINVGDTVRWTFMDVGHNVISGNTCIANNIFCTPDNTNCANQASVPGGTVYTRTFNQAGNFAYFCSPHCFNGMVGTVQVNAVAPTRPVHADFDGDHKTDVSVFRPANGFWYIFQSSNSGFRAEPFGANGDLPAPADYDGDQKNDLAVFRPSTGTFYILQSLSNTLKVDQFGANGDRPMPGDYDGDGKADVGVFRPSNGLWYRLNSSNGAFNAVAWGNSTDKPALGDFDGDGKTDQAVFRPADGQWYILQSLNGFRSQPFGANGDTPVAADYDGDNKSDVAVFRPSNGTWYISLSSNNGFRADTFGQLGDIPALGDYDGDNKADVAVFRPSTGTYYILQSLNGFRAQAWGTNGDIPAPSAYVP